MRAAGARGRDSEVYDHIPCNEEGETGGLIIREVKLQRTGDMRAKDVKNSQRRAINITCSEIHFPRTRRKIYARCVWK